MAACDFAYHRPHQLSEAVDLLAAEDGARPLAGGQTLLPQLFSRRATCHSLIDLSHVEELAETHEEPASTVIGAMCRQAAIERRLRLRPIDSMLAAVLSRLGPAAVRGRGTIGGNLAVGDPASELLAVGVAQEWRLRLQSGDGLRDVDAQSFVTAPYRTVITRGELLRSITIPRCEDEGWAIEDVRPSRTARPIAGVAAQIGLAEGRTASARVVAFATGAPPHRLPAVESRLLGEVPGERLIDLAAREAEDAVDARDDLAVSAAWRRTAIARLVRRALRAAVGRVPAESGVRHV